MSFTIKKFKGIDICEQKLINDHRIDCKSTSNLVEELEEFESSFQ